MIFRGLTLAFAIALVAEQTLAQAPSSCDVTLNVSDQDPNGLNVRATPGGEAVDALKAKGRWVQVHVTGARGGWAHIDRATYMADDPERRGSAQIVGIGDNKAYGWVALSKLGFEELNSPSRILASPEDGSRVLLRVEKGDESKLPHANVLGCSGPFLRVKVGPVVGWTRDFCSNQLTTCV